MKQVNFTHEGGFPLEQETLERLQTAYRFELFEALKSHLSIETKIDNNYIIANATIEKKGWAIIHQYEKDPKSTTEAQILQGILYPIKEGTATGYLKTTRKGTNLTFGTGVSQTAYFDYEAAYISQHDFSVGVPQNSDALIENYFELKNFKTVKDLQKIEEILDAVDAKITAIKTNITKIEGDINVLNDSYLPLKGYKAMEGDLNLGSYQLSKLDIKESGVANVRVADFRLGSIDRKGKIHPEDSTGRALVDSSNETATSLWLNYRSDWENTYIGGKVHLNDINTSTEDFTVSQHSDNSLLLINSENQALKSSNLLNSLLSRITKLEKRTSDSTIPIGMIAIWGRPANEIPAGWVEYIDLKGRVPVGVDTSDPLLNKTGNQGGSKNAVIVSHNHTISNSGNVNNGETGGEITNKIARWDRGSGSLLNGTISTVGESGTNKNMQPYNVVHFIEYTGMPSDTTAPTSPGNLTASNIGTESLTLTWTTSTDNAGVTNYLVYKDNSNIPLAELGNILTYNVAGLSANTNYSFQVRAKDTAGNLSTASNTVNATTTIVDTIAPSKPLNLKAQIISSTELSLRWDLSTDNIGVTNYLVYKNNVLIATLNNSPLFVGGLSPNSSYIFHIVAKDAAGNSSINSDYLTAKTLP